MGSGSAHGGDHTESPALDWTFLKGERKRFSVSITSSERCDYDGTSGTRWHTEDTQ